MTPSQRPTWRPAAEMPHWQEPTSSNLAACFTGGPVGIPPEKPLCVISASRSTGGLSGLVGYRRLQRAVADQVTVDRIKELIADLTAQKAVTESSHWKKRPQRIEGAEAADSGWATPRRRSGPPSPIATGENVFGSALQVTIANVKETAPTRLKSWGRRLCLPTRGN
jgi:hypothetical protein